MQSQLALKYKILAISLSDKALVSNKTDKKLSFILTCSWTSMSRARLNNYHQCQDVENLHQLGQRPQQEDRVCCSLLEYDAGLSILGNHPFHSIINMQSKIR
jgi:hypothetical protein